MERDVTVTPRRQLRRVESKKKRVLVLLGLLSVISFFIVVVGYILLMYRSKIVVSPVPENSAIQIEYISPTLQTTPSPQQSETRDSQNTPTISPNE